VSNKLNAFTINTLNQAEDIILVAKKYNIKPILHFKKYILKGFGSDFILTFQKILKSKFGNSSFKLFVDCGFDSSLSIKMATNKIEFIKLNGSLIILKKVKNIADKNRVLLNPSFNIVDCRNIKNINLKIKKLHFRNKNEDRR
tara:strand:+ start:1710 stop:2138 length:429 start_codon:yes stop_codon:yes gene_type:complete